MIVGLTGGIGSGKTEVAKVFSQLGALVIDTDVLAREVVEPGSDGLREIERTWPNVVRNGVLDRAALGRIVFNDASAREKLNAMLHPRIRALARERSQSAAPGQLVVQVIPLLFETGLEREVDATVVVIAPETARVARIAQRDRTNEDEIRARISAQIDPEEARRRANVVIENAGGLEDLRKQAGVTFHSLSRV